MGCSACAAGCRRAPAADAAGAGSAAGRSAKSFLESTTSLDSAAPSGALVGRLESPLRYIQPARTAKESAHARMKLRSIAHPPRNWIVAVAPAGVTTQKPLTREPRALQQTELVDRADRVIRTAWLKAADRTDKRRNGQLVDPQQPHRECSSDARHSSRAAARPSPRAGGAQTVSSRMLAISQPESSRAGCRAITTMSELRGS